VKSGIDAVFDQPRHGDPGQIGANQRKNAQDKKAPVTVD
jgi:hypothetical protein